MPARRKPLERPYHGHHKRAIGTPERPGKARVTILTPKQRAASIARMEEIDRQMDPEGYARRKAQLAEHLDEDFGPWDD